MEAAGNKLKSRRRAREDSRRPLLPYLMLWLAASQAGAANPLVARFLDEVDEKMAQGRLTAEQATALALELDASAGCRDVWAAATEWQSPALEEAARTVCPPGADSAREPAGRRKFAAGIRAVGALHPRDPSRDGFSARLDGRFPHGEAGIAWRDSSLEKRHLELGTGSGRAGGLSLHAGNILQSLSEARLPFVVGRSTYPGLGSRGAWQPLFSTHPGPNGLGLGYAGAGLRGELYGAWNRAVRDSLPLDVLQYAAGASLGRETWRLRMQGLLLRYEPQEDPALNHWVGGLEARGPAGMHAGAGYSFYSGERRHGWHAELGLAGNPGRWRHSLRLFQSGPDWMNPLTHPSRRRRDTSEAGFNYAGRGEGGLRLRSAVPLQETENPLRLKAGSDLHWLWMRSDWMQQDFHLDLEKDFERWTAGLRGRWHWGMEGTQGDPDSRPVAAAMAGYRAQSWRAGAEMALKGGDYGGDFPRALEAEWAWLRAGRDALRLTALTGDVLDPLGRLRLYASQDFAVAKGILLTSILKMPWSRGDLEKGLSYRVQLQAVY